MLQERGPLQEASSAGMQAISRLGPTGSMRNGPSSTDPLPPIPGLESLEGLSLGCPKEESPWEAVG